jgi:hypothetical protein
LSFGFKHADVSRIDSAGNNKRLIGSVLQAFNDKRQMILLENANKFYSVCYARALFVCGSRSARGSARKYVAENRSNASRYFYRGIN